MRDVQAVLAHARGEHARRGVRFFALGTFLPYVAPWLEEGSFDPTTRGCLLGLYLSRVDFHNEAARARRAAAIKTEAGRRCSAEPVGIEMGATSVQQPLSAGAGA